MCADRWRPGYLSRPSPEPHSNANAVTAGASGPGLRAADLGNYRYKYRMYVWTYRQSKGKEQGTSLVVRTFCRNSGGMLAAFVLPAPKCDALGGTLARFARHKRAYEELKVYEVYSGDDPSNAFGRRPLTVQFPGPVPLDIKEAPGCCQWIHEVTIAQVMEQLEMPDSTPGRPIASTSSIAHPSTSAVTARDLRNYRQPTSRHSSPAYAVSSALVSMAATTTSPARHSSNAGPVSTNRQSATTAASAKPRLKLTRVTVYITYDERAGEYVHRYVGPAGPAQRLSKAQLNNPDNAEELSVAYKATAEGVSKGCVCYLVL